MIQLANGVEQLHHIGIIHRDLKPDNIFITDSDTLKIGDFGVSRQIELNERAKTRIGTPRYAAPEVTGKSGYTLSSDMWSLGLVTDTFEQSAFFQKYGNICVIW